jgi:hypothetical protein
MKSPVMVDGDKLTFHPFFGHRTVVPLPGMAKIQGSGHATIGNKKVCVQGDEHRVIVPANYLIPGYTPGTGSIIILSLDKDQVMSWCTSERPVIVRGPLLTTFIALFIPLLPALGPPPGLIPDIPAPTPGVGLLRPSQRRVRAG